ncbi:COG1913 Predicted Zn-dependent proteases [Flavobacteriaceae bacterium]
MKKLLLIIPIVLIVLTSFYFLKPVKTIYIQPLGEVSPEYIALVKKSIKTFYGFECIIKPEKSITKNMLSPIRKRIDADKAILQNLSFDNYIIITEKDICHRKDQNNTEYGILGLGGICGKTCIISTFRLKRKVSKQKILERLEKVALHEIGHNLGLNHCENNNKCMMSSAKGAISQVDYEGVWFCEKCMKQIKK